MSRLSIFLGKDIFEKIEYPILAVDCSGYHLVSAGYSGFKCIGDFDSCNDDIVDEISNNSELIKYPSVKDFGDLELAINYAIEHNYSEIIIYNFSTGNRADHYINNFRIFYKYCNSIDIFIKDKYNYGYFIANENEIYKNDYEYVSFFAFSNVECLKISNDFYYPFEGNVNQCTTQLISNKLINNVGNVSVSNDKILVLFSIDN